MGVSRNQDTYESITLFSLHSISWELTVSHNSFNPFSAYLKNRVLFSKRYPIVVFFIENRQEKCLLYHHLDFFVLPNEPSTSFESPFSSFTDVFMITSSMSFCVHDGWIFCYKLSSLRKLKDWLCRGIMISSHRSRHLLLVLL